MLDFDLPMYDNDLELGVSTEQVQIYIEIIQVLLIHIFLGALASVTGNSSPYAGDTNYHYFFL